MIPIHYIVIAFFARELLFYYSTQTLINKLMARDFHDYNFTKNIAKTMKQGTPLAQGVTHEEGVAEDLSPLQEFQGLN